MIVGFSGRAGSGKTRASKWLIERYPAYRRVAFASTLKAMMLQIPGIGEAEVFGDRKEASCAALGGATPRHAMQTLGTEWARGIDPDLWIRAWWERARLHDHVVADDVRFANEAEFIRSKGGVVIRLGVFGEVRRHDHVSEDLAFGGDFEIVVPRGPGHLEEALEELWDRARL